MARLLYGFLFILPNTAVTLDWKAFSSVKNYFYQHQNITIIIKGESETCPNFWNRHIISLSKLYRFIWSCRFVFLVLNLIFPPSRFSLLSSGRSLCYLPHFAPTASRKKTSSQKYSLERNAKHYKGLIEDYAGKFHQEANGSKLSKRWLAQLSENPVDCVCGRSLFAKQENFFSAVFSEQFFHQKRTL